MFGNSVFFIYNENREFYQTMHGPEEIRANGVMFAAGIITTAIVGSLAIGLLAGFYRVVKWTYAFIYLIKDYLLTWLLVRQANIKLQEEAAYSHDRSRLAKALYDKLCTTYPEAQKSTFLLLQDDELRHVSIEHPLVMFAEQMTKYFACVHRAASGQPFSVTELSESWQNAQACLTCMETHHGGMRFQGGKAALFADARKVLIELESYLLRDLAQRNKRNLYQLQSDRIFLNADAQLLPAKKPEDIVH